MIAGDYLPVDNMKKNGHLNTYFLSLPDLKKTVFL
jgi:hypothetical protein